MTSYNPVPNGQPSSVARRKSFRMEQGCVAMLHDRSFLSPTAGVFASQEIDFDFCMRPTDIVRAHSRVTATSVASKTEIR
mmetsp:Transcript_24111/g.66841  ORF Transcript_24111/g.66841 Transcript_24111/m.66841 type:complete len:80 (-) Transcript_24111:615-854(-)